MASFTTPPPSTTCAAAGTRSPPTPTSAVLEVGLALLPVWVGIVGGLVGWGVERQGGRRAEGGGGGRGFGG